MLIDSPIQVDIQSLDDYAMDNLKKVYQVMGALLEEGNTLDTLSKSVVQDVLTKFNEIKVRDGVIKYFTYLPKDMRLDALKNLTLYVDYTARNTPDVELIADSTAYLGALMAVHTAFKVELDEDVDTELEIISGLFNDVEKLTDQPPSLMRLIQVTMAHNVPLTVFKDSIDALTLEECIQGAE